MVTTAYQAEATIIEAVESALRQTRPPHEVVVVDDGSTDGTAMLLERYRGRVVLLHQQNRGRAAALNAAVGRATGDFVAILDADDVFAPERLEALTELAVARPDLDLLMTDLFFERGGEVIGRFCDETPFPDVDQNIAIFDRCFLAEPAVRRSRFLAVGGADDRFRIAHDWELWIRLLHSGARAGLVAEPLLRYRLKSSSLAESRVEALRARVAVLESASRLDLSADERRELDHFLVRRRRRVVLAEAEEALRTRAPDARRRALLVARDSEMPLFVRVEAVVAAVMPKLAARRLARRQLAAEKRRGLASS